MTDLDRRIQEAFDDVSMPPELKEQTLHYIKEKRTAQAPVTQVAQHVPATPTAATAPQPPPRSAATKTRQPFMQRFGFAVAACLVLCALGFGGFKLYTTQTAFVDIDVNPSIGLGLNIFDIVVSAEPLNEDGTQILSDVDLVGKSYDSAMDDLLGSDAFLTYIDTDSFVGVSVVSDDERQSAALAAECEQKLATLPCNSVCGKATLEERNVAREEGMGVNRYKAALELMRLDPSVSMEECRSMPMRELRSRISALDPDSAYSAPDAEHGQGSGVGQGMGGGHGAGSGYGAGNGQGGGSRHGEAS